VSRLGTDLDEGHEEPPVVVDEVTEILMVDNAGILKDLSELLVGPSV